MPWYSVNIGWSYSCGGEYECYITKARSKNHAKEKVLEVHGELGSRDQIEVDKLTNDPTDTPRVYDNGVIYTHFDYWER